MADNPDDRPPGRVIGDILVRNNLITPEKFAVAIARAARSGSLMHTLEEMGVADEAALVRLFAEHYRVQTLDLDKIEQPDEEVLRLLPREYCERHRVLPIMRNGNMLVVVFADPGNVLLSDEVESITRLKVEVVVASARAIRDACTKYYAALERTDLRSTLEADMQEMSEGGELQSPDDGNASVQDLERSAEAAPVIRIVNNLLTDAIMRGVSDIHIERYEKEFRIRFRIDGVLYEVVSPPPQLSNAIVSRIKVMSRLDIAERRMPQDGRMKFRLRTGRECDFRVSVVPFHYGEKVVLRLLDKTTLQTDMERLGFEKDDLARFKHAIHQPYGMVLVTGPTGSGKTTTLYSALAERNCITDNISTAEDPIEFDISGINQLQMNDPIGLDFAKALRAFLRQDPDIIMVGEIRDYETAEIAVKAALTGHLVLSTLHTNDAAGAISRLTNMGVEAFLLTEALLMVVAQRLVRCTCVNCRKPHRWPKDECVTAGMTEVEYEAASMLRGDGCAHCNGTGMRGRIAIYEILPMTDAMREALLTGVSPAELKRVGVREGMQTLRRAVLKKFAEGVTTLEEVLRVTRAD